MAAFFLISPVLDIVTNAWPIALGQEEWRFGFVGIASNYLVSILFGTILVAFVAAAAGHRTVLRITGWLSWITVVILAVLLVSLVLDTLQLRAAVRPDALTMFKIGAAKTAIKIGAVIVVMGIVAVCCARAARDAGTGRADREGGPVILGT